MTPLLSLISRHLKPSRRRDASRAQRRRARLILEALEERLAPAVVIPNDPQFSQQWPLHNTGQTGGLYDADIDMPEAWTVTTGSMATVVAILDSGVDYTHPDLYMNIWLNEGEIPAPIAGSLVDTDNDAIITFRDLNASANAAHVTDVNGNGYIDGGDLLNDTRWENGLDEDGNGKLDDLIGWDTHNNDNDPQAVGENHGTEMALIMGATTNNGTGSAGVNWMVRIMPVCVQFDPESRINANAAAGLDYAVGEEASISYNRRDNPDNTFSQEMFDAIDRARTAGHLFLGGAGNLSRDMDATPFYPGAYDLDNILVVTAVDASDELTSISNWGLNNVDLAAPTPTGFGSQALAYTTGVAALLKSQHPDWNYAQIKARLMATVDPLPSLAGKTVTGGRLNAASALGYVWPTTKFYVVDDASSNRTYEYEATFGPVENYTLNSGNTAPRGAASTAAGDKVWVVDANKKVYVYNDAGALLGSWTAGSLQASAQLEGIATNGTDIWLVDAKADKVFRYAGAATRLSGSQNAAGSFSLNSGNKDPRDIVTDGASLWVVNNSSTDKVFKYSLTGALQGNWTISTSGATSPTGITLDPANPQHLWIVDSGTDRVYQYDNAAGRTSGSQSASTSFALAPGNTNPQGIADPPAPGTVVGPTAETITAADVEPPPVEVLPGWMSAAAGNAAPGATDVRSAGLGGATLGRASGSGISLDDAAAAWGWFGKTTPWDDSGFTPPANQGEQNRIHRVTALMDEIGRPLGHDRNDEGLMFESLAAGERHIPSATLTYEQELYAWALAESEKD